MKFMALVWAHRSRPLGESGRARSVAARLASATLSVEGGRAASTGCGASLHTRMGVLSFARRLSFAMMFALGGGFVLPVHADAIRKPEPVATTIDCGPACVGTPYPHVLMVENPTPSALTIGKVRTSCECLQLLSYPRTIPPGMTGAIEVRLVPDRSGRVEYKLFVECSDKDAPVRVYALTGTIQPSPSGGGSGPFPDIAPTLFARAVTERDNSHYLSPQAVQERIGRGGATIVDVRDSADFGERHIPGSLNIPLHAVKTKPFLKQADVVLVDKGYGSETLEQECGRLGKAGFASVSILQGGVYVWSRQGGRLEGAATAANGPALITAAEFYPVRKFSDWLVVDATESAGVESEYLLPERVAVLFSGDGVAFAEAVKSLVGRGRPVRSILILNQAGDNYKAVAEALNDVGEVNVFCLAGGLEGYANHLRALSAMNENRTNRTGSAALTSRGARKPCGCSR